MGKHYTAIFPVRQMSKNEKGQTVYRVVMPGEVIELDDDTAARLLEHGTVRPVKGQGPIETLLDGLGISAPDKKAAGLAEAGIDTIEQLRAADAKDLTAVSGIGDSTAEKIISAATMKPDEGGE